MNGSDAEFDDSPDSTTLDAQLLGVIDDYMGQHDVGPEDTVGLRERILNLVRDDLYRGPSTDLVTERGNPFSISVAAVRSIVRDAVDSVEGIRARSVSVLPAGSPAGSEAAVRMTVVMKVGIEFTAVADRIRQAVADALRSELGIPAEAIDIEAEDVYVD